MKANELMIGDWVLIGNNHISVTSLQEGRDYVEAQPIPLTAEILEKNGWEWEERRSEWILIIGTIHLCWGFYEGCISASDWDNEGDVQITSLRCEFVHQLQHALRLCGIDKEINL